MQKFLILKVTIFLSVGFSVPVLGEKGIFIPKYFEQSCSPDQGFVTASFNRWMANVTTPLYYPLMSTLHILRFTQNLFKQADLNFLNVHDVLNSCVTVVIRNQAETLSGYCGLNVTMQNIKLPNNVTLWDKVFPEGLGGVFRISLSDNKSWLVVDACWDDGHRTFAVLSIFPTLSPCDLKVIVAHLKAIGFKPEFVTRLNYNPVTCSCQDSQTVINPS